MIKPILKAFLGVSFIPVFSPRVSVKLQRSWINGIGKVLLGPRGVEKVEAPLKTIPTLRFMPESGETVCDILYLHGGGYVLGGEGTHGTFAAHLAKRLQARVWLPDYRLAPEHPFPAAPEDALTAYQGLLESGVDARRIVIAGDSAGGGLTLALAQMIRDKNLPLPAALIVLSPWTDLSLSGASHQTLGKRDPMLTTAGLRHCAALYCGTEPVENPLCSSLFANLQGLPPLLIQVGSEEILLSDAEQLAQRAQAQGVVTYLQRYEGMWHVFQLQAGLLDESNQAVAAMGEFIQPLL